MPKIIKQKVPLDELAWIKEPIEDSELTSRIVFAKSRYSLCPICRGSRALCGKEKCPVLLRFLSQLEVHKSIKSTRIEGSTPPSVFVGRLNYPKVYIGPLVSLEEDSYLLDTPELWWNASIDKLVKMRVSLIRGKRKIHVKRFGFEERFVDILRELVLSSSSVEIEAKFSKRPTSSILIDDHVQPFGPSAPIENLKLGSYSSDHRIEKVYYDWDLDATDAIIKLYEEGLMVSHIQRVLSLGMIGLKRRRKLVPTRWSITAVDDTISRNLVAKIKAFPVINECRVYEVDFLGNKFIVLLVPSKWSYELIEAWFPGSTWNPFTRHVVVYSDWEGNKGRTEYAEIGGCYYAARLAVSEHLVKEKRQALAIVFKESYPDYIMPVGVWHVREGVRRALSTRPRLFDSLDSALKFVNSRLKLGLNVFATSSSLLDNFLRQKKLNQFY